MIVIMTMMIMHDGDDNDQFQACTYDDDGSDSGNDGDDDFDDDFDDHQMMMIRVLR